MTGSCAGEADALALLLARTDAVVEMRVDGDSMGPALLRGADVRVVRVRYDAIQRQDVVAFRAAGEQLTLHRVVALGRGHRVRHFLLLQGDRNLICDPPVPHAHVIGRVIAQRTNGGEWASPASRMPLSPFREFVSRTALACMRLTLEIDVRATQLVTVVALAFITPVALIRYGRRARVPLGWSMMRSATAARIPPER